MLDQESAGHLFQFAAPVKALVEDVAKSLNITIEKPTDADALAGRVVILPSSAQLADAHYNAGFIRRTCQNHGMHVDWEGATTPEALDKACSFTFSEMAVHVAARAAKEAAKEADAERAAAPRMAEPKEAEPLPEPPPEPVPEAASAEPVRPYGHNKYRR